MGSLERNYYQLLEIEPSASEEDIRRAYRRLKEIYGVDSPAAYGAYTSRELEGLLQRFEDAHATLIDSEKRALYDMELRAGASAGAAADKVRSVRVTPAPEESLRPAVDLEELCGPDAVFNGELLRAVRIARGVTLDELADKTKVKASYLRALEEEEWDLLPASIYVRGFLSGLARELKLDSRRVVETYFPRLKQYYREKERD